MGIKKPKDVYAVYLEAERGNDRAAALVAVAMVEYALECLIESSLRQLENKSDQGLLFSDRGLFNSFALKIFAAYAMNLIEEDAREDLDRLRAIRNSFAHDPNPMAFDTQAVAARIDALAYPKSDEAKAADDAGSAPYSITAATATRRRIFLGTSYHYASELLGAANLKLETRNLLAALSSRAGSVKHGQEDG